MENTEGGGLKKRRRAYRGARQEQVTEGAGRRQAKVLNERLVLGEAAAEGGGAGGSGGGAEPAGAGSRGKEGAQLGGERCGLLSPLGRPASVRLSGSRRRLRLPS